MKTAYELLGVTRGATPNEIEQRYRLALNAEIIRNAGRRLSRRERTRLHNLRQAYLLLASPVRRDAYDRALLARAQSRERFLGFGGMALALFSLLAGAGLLGGSLYEARQSGVFAAHRAAPTAAAIAHRPAGERQDRPIATSARARP